MQNRMKERCERRVMTKHHNEPTFWGLSYIGQGFRGIEEPDLAHRDIIAELAGERVGGNWMPPKYKIIGQGKWPDWMCFPIPLISSRALDCLRDLIEPCCEVLRWFGLPDRSYYLLNVLCVVPRDLWSCEGSTVQGDVITSFERVIIQQTPIPDMFRLEGHTRRLFVSDALARRSFEARLRGALFVDPSISGMNLAFIAEPTSAAGTGFIRREDDI
jgi:hypothetical protein